MAMAQKVQQHARVVRLPPVQLCITVPVPRPGAYGSSCSPVAWQILPWNASWGGTARECVAHGCRPACPFARRYRRCAVLYRYCAGFLGARRNDVRLNAQQAA